MPNPTQHTSNFVSGSSGNTIAKAYTGAVTSGATLAAVVMWSSTTATVTVSDSVNGAWTVDANSLASGGSRRAQWFYFKSTASGTPTVTATVSGNVTERNIHIFEIPTINQTTPVDSSLGATGTSTTPTVSPTVVASTQVTLLGAAYGGGTSATGTGFTAGENTDGNQSEFKLSTGTGAQAVAFTMTPSQAWAASAIAFLDAAGGTSATVTAVAATAAGSAPAASVSGTGSGTVTAVPATAAGSAPAAVAHAGATVSGVAAAAAGTAPPANQILSAVITATPATAAGGAPSAFVSGGGSATASAVAATASATAPAGSLSAGQAVGGVPAVAAGSAPAAAPHGDATVSGVPALASGQIARPAITPAPTGGTTGQVAVTFSERSG